MGTDRYPPVKHKHNGYDPAHGDSVAPVIDDDITRGDFERDQGSLEDEEVVACRDSKGVIDIAGSEPDERR